MFSLVSRKFLAMRNIVLYSVLGHHCFCESSCNFQTFIIKSLFFGKSTTYLPSISMGDICKYQQLFWALYNSFLNQTQTLIQHRGPWSGFHIAFSSQVLHTTALDQGPIIVISVVASNYRTVRN